jgi:hypothetical protein
MACPASLYIAAVPAHVLAFMLSNSSAGGVVRVYVCSVSVIGGTCLTSVACRFRTALIWLSVIYTVIVGCSLLASIFVLFDSMKPHQLQFAHAEESPWEQALMMSMDAELHHKQKRGIVSSEYGTQARASKFVTGMYDSGPPAKEKQKTLGM